MTDFTREQLDALLRAADEKKAQRAELMPDEMTAVGVMWSAFQRLKELGWRETCYAKTNERVQIIEAGSGGIHIGSRWKDWPSKDWMIEGADDLWPSTPCLFKALPDDIAEGSQHG